LAVKELIEKGSKKVIVDYYNIKKAFNHTLYIVEEENKIYYEPIKQF